MMDVLLVGFIRPMKAYPNLDALKSAINSDILKAEREMEGMNVTTLIERYFL
ncbi:hypothetical protein DICVIV_06710 [Dictyocaulus viviparus]|uniref:riboflavin kinase n=1 Tax=Dictyocaulus viviparus TaxID=29172 RepID=A0A0D8XTX5_DICVI|nr:hypothetical protein DICVIV_06710 [Dictyocaulus viviparus]